MQHRSLFPTILVYILGAGWMLGCGALLPDSRIRIGGNSPKGLYAGAASESITPDITETFLDEDYASDGSGAADHRAPNGVFDGTLGNPDGSSGGRQESFVDANGNGKFDPVWLAGSFGRRPANEVHDKLWVRAVAVRSGPSTVAFVTIDAIGYFNDEIQAIREEVQQTVELEYLVMSASHSHETPDLIGIWGAEDGLPGWNADYRQWVRKQTVKAVVAAALRAVPAEIAVNSGDIISPESHRHSGSMHYDARDPVSIDSNIGVLQFRRPKGNAIATLVTWAGHPEHMIDDNFISADYPHYLRERLEAEYPESMALFVNGVLGGQIGTNHAPVARAGEVFRGEGDKRCRHEKHSYEIHRLETEGACPFAVGDTEWMWRKAEAVGINVAERAIELLVAADVAKSPKIEIESRVVFLPIENKGYRLLIVLGALMDRLLFTDATGSREGDPKDYSITDNWFLRTDVQRINFETGDEILLQILTIPGEMFPELSVGGWKGEHTGGIQPLVDPGNPNPPYAKLDDGSWDFSGVPEGPYLREKMQGKHNFLFGLTGDELGYIIPAANWKLDAENPYLSEAAGDHYEETNSLGPLTAELLFKAYDELLEK